MLRDQPDGYKEYDCPELAPSMETIDTYNQFIGPVKMLLQMAQNDIIESLLNFVDNLVTSAAKLFGLRQYPGTEFCQGVFYGILMTNTILEMLKVMLDLI